MGFEEEAARGRLCVPSCPRCGGFWPPSPACPRCGGPSALAPSSGRGRVVSCSSDAGGHFGLAEFDGTVRVICRIEGPRPPRPGDALSLASCGRAGGRLRFLARLGAPGGGAPGGRPT